MFSPFPGLEMGQSSPNIFGTGEECCFCVWLVWCSHRRTSASMSDSGGSELSLNRLPSPHALAVLN
jgi:hypothetical protein